MVQRFIFSALTFLAAASLAAPPPATKSAKLPDDIVRLKQTFLQDAERTVKPLRDRYVADLTRLLEQLTRAGKLDDALALKAEIASLAASGPALLETVEHFESNLIGTSWLWGNKEKFTFATEGKAPGRKFTWKTLQPFTIEFEYPGGHHGTIVFDPSLKTAKINEIAPNGKPDSPALIRVGD